MNYKILRFYMGGGKGWGRLRSFHVRLPFITRTYTERSDKSYCRCQLCNVPEPLEFAAVVLLKKNITAGLKVYTSKLSNVQVWNANNSATSNCTKTTQWEMTEVCTMYGDENQPSACPLHGSSSRKHRLLMSKMSIMDHRHDCLKHEQRATVDFRMSWWTEKESAKSQEWKNVL